MVVGMVIGMVIGQSDLVKLKLLYNFYLTMLGMETARE